MDSHTLLLMLTHPKLVFLNTTKPLERFLGP
jgi:hypothetical protein